MQKPVLQAMVVADHVYKDAVSGKFLICGTFTSYRRKVQPPQAAGGSQSVRPNDVIRAGTPWLYCAFVDALGTIQLALRYVNLATGEALFEGNLELTSDDPLRVVECALPLPPLWGDAGHYSLDLLFSDEILGSWRITVLDSETLSPEARNAPE